MASTYQFRIPSPSYGELKKFGEYLDKLKHDLLKCGFDHKQMNTVVKYMKELLHETEKTLSYFLENTETNPNRIIHDVFENCQKSLQLIDTRYKRYL